MGHHLTESGTFKSDKYEWCPEGFFAMKFTDPVARAMIVAYALMISDQELSHDLLRAAYMEVELL